MLSAVVTIGFNAFMYSYGFFSCRPGGHIWQTISGYEGGEMINMTGTWLALPLAALDHPWKDLQNATCGGTINGHRPAPDWDTYVCTPLMDIRAEDSYTTWKRSLPSMAALMLIFLLSAWCAEVRSPHFRLCVHLLFGVFVIFISFGLLGTAIVGIMGSTIALVPRLFPPSSRAALPVIWALAIVCMQLVSFFLGQHPHKVPGWNYGQGIKYWSTLEEMVCGTKLEQPQPNSQVCFISKPFLTSGLAPWFVFRFMALKFISLAADTLWFYEAKPERAGIESKSDLVQRTERHLTEPAEPDQEALTGTSTNFYSPKYYLAYLGYPPLFFAGPILSYNAFVSQLERPILSYTAGMSPDEQAKKARQAVVFYCIRLLLLMIFIEFFTVYWWYSQKLHQLTCTSQDEYQRCLFDDLSPWELYIAMHVVLHFTWLSLMIIWRFGRFLALADGIDSFENMLECVSLNYTFVEFWRIWHASMNEFMLRYLYWPLGGKHRSWLAVPVVFLFVGFWHERTGLGTQPGWYAWALMNAAGVVINKVIEESLNKYRTTGQIPTQPPGRWIATLEMSRLSDRPHRWVAQVIFFLGKGIGPVALILVNAPAIFLSSSLRFYRSLLFRGWESATLLLTLVFTFACNAQLVDALRAPKSSRREPAMQ